MKCKILLSVAIAAIFQAASLAQAAPLTFDGITFPEGEESFADQYLDVTVGDPAPSLGAFNPGAALGTPDDGGYSMGQGGFMTLQFTDNSLTGSGDANNDLHIFEVGPLVEDTFVWISQDNLDFLSVGSVTGSTSSIDIDPFLSSAGIDPFTKFSFVRLQDDPNENTRDVSYAGADIDAVGAITSAPPAPPVSVPEPGSLALLIGGLLTAGLRRVKLTRKH